MPFLRVQILSFQHTKFSKCNHLGSPCPPYEVQAPMGNPGSATVLFKKFLKMCIPHDEYLILIYSIHLWRMKINIDKCTLVGGMVPFTSKFFHFYIIILFNKFWLTVGKIMDKSHMVSLMLPHMVMMYLIQRWVYIILQFISTSFSIFSLYYQ